MNGKAVGVLTVVVGVMLASMLAAAPYVATKSQVKEIVKESSPYVRDEKAIRQSLEAIKSDLSILKVQIGTLNLQLGEALGRLASRTK